MRILTLSIVLLLFGSHAHAEQFGFIYTWGGVHSYNSFTETYSRLVCGPIVVFNAKIALSEEELLKIKKGFEKVEFWHLPEDYFERYGPSDKITVTSPCGEQKFVAQKDTEINFMVFSCGSIPRLSEYGNEILSIGKQIEDIVEATAEFGMVKESKCRFY